MNNYVHWVRVISSLITINSILCVEFDLSIDFMVSILIRRMFYGRVIESDTNVKTQDFFLNNVDPIVWIAVTSDPPYRGLLPKVIFSIRIVPF